MGLWSQRWNWLNTVHRADLNLAWQDIVGIFLSRKVQRLQQEQSNMNKDQVKGMAKNVTGIVQEQAGKLAGSKEQQIKGLSKQISGKVQKAVGDVEQSVKDHNKK
jgi:uncharacterized protein YjbJ (UPF0337 family)